MKTIHEQLKRLRNPNKIGEILRDYCFVNDEYKDAYGRNPIGCYETFKLREGFFKITPKIAKAYLKAKYNIDDVENEWLYSNNLYVNPKDEIFICWAWNGDGHLIIDYHGKVVENSDCKCDYTWEFLK